MCVKLEGSHGTFVKFELEVAVPGDYKLYLSYLKDPECGKFDLMQRQIALKTIDGYADKRAFIEKEYIGQLNIKEGTNTITVKLLHIPKGLKSNMLFLQRLYLERI